MDGERLSNLAPAVGRYAVGYPTAVAVAAATGEVVAGVRFGTVVFFAFVGTATAAMVGSWGFLGDDDSRDAFGELRTAGRDGRWTPSPVLKLVLFAFGLVAFGGLSTLRYAG